MLRKAPVKSRLLRKARVRSRVLRKARVRSRVLRKALDAVVDLPQRAQAGVEDSIQALAAAAEDIRELRVTVQRLDRRVARIEKQLNGRLATIESLVSELAHDVDHATDRLPRQDRGPLGKARDALTGDR
jgi:predicted  nucleic acid-binding Zn-ribbon protein